MHGPALERGPHGSFIQLLEAPPGTSATMRQDLRAQTSCWWLASACKSLHKGPAGERI